MSSVCIGHELELRLRHLKDACRPFLECHHTRSSARDAALELVRWFATATAITMTDGDGLPTSTAMTVAKRVAALAAETAEIVADDLALWEWERVQVAVQMVREHLPACEGALRLHNEPACEL